MPAGGTVFLLFSNKDDDITAISPSPAGTGVVETLEMVDNFYKYGILWIRFHTNSERGILMKDLIEKFKIWIRENRKKAIAIGSTAGAAVLLIAGTVTFVALNAGGGLEVVSSSGTDPVSGTLSVSSTEIPKSTETVQNEDGTTTVVEQYADGTVKEVTTAKDGSVKEVTRQKDGTTKEVTTKKDGTVTEVTTNKDGSTTQTTTKPNGETQTVIKPSGGNGGSSSSKPSNDTSSKPQTPSKPSGGGSTSSKPSGSSSTPSKPESTPSKPSGGGTSSTPKPPVESKPEEPELPVNATIPEDARKYDPLGNKIKSSYTEAEIQASVNAAIKYLTSQGMKYWPEMNKDNSSWEHPVETNAKVYTPYGEVVDRLLRYKAEGIYDFGLYYEPATWEGQPIWWIYVFMG